MSDDHSSASADLGDDSELARPDSPRTSRDRSLLHQAGDVLENLRSQLSELDRREQHVAAQTTALEQERRILRLSSQEFEDQMKQREASFAEQEESLKRRLDEIETARRQIDEDQSKLDQVRAELDGEREKLRDELNSELEQDRSQLNQERAEFDQRVADHEERWQDGLAAIDAELEQERETRRGALEADLEQLEQSIAVRKSAWDEEQSRRQEQFESEAAQQRADLRSELDAVREEQLGEIERREQNLHRKQVDLEKRTRFHERHLEQLRRTLEQEQTDVDHRRQLHKCELVQADELIDRRRRQLAQFHVRLRQREESLGRERRLLDDARAALELRRSEEDKAVHHQRAAWNEESQALRADVRRQQDMLTLHAQNLEARRSRLDELRDALEETHRETLELRLVAEQVWAQLSQTFGEEATRVRVEQARKELLSGYEKSHDSLIEQQQEIIEAETRLEEQRDRFRQEREEFAGWMDERERQLADQERSLQRDLEAAAAAETEWRATRERWTLEKIEAESVIRQLLDELDADLIPMNTPAPGDEQEGGNEAIGDAPITDDDSQAAA